MKLTQLRRHPSMLASWLAAGVLMVAYSAWVLEHPLGILAANTCLKSVTEGNDDVTRYIVMIKCRLGRDDSYGAGIIFGAEAQSGRLYIATANHVVRGIENVAEGIQVEIKSRPGEHFPAKLLDNADGSLDLAVLSLEGLNSSVGQTPFQVWGTRRASTPVMSLIMSVFQG
jgi:S1-C subfamily serine protease